MKLTNNFTLEEFERSSTAAAHKIDNKIPENYYGNLYKLANMLQKIRDRFGKPIRITSGYRCEELNKLVKGSKTSQHRFAQAADITSSNNGAL